MKRFFLELSIIAFIVTAIRLFIYGSYDKSIATYVSLFIGAASALIFIFISANEVDKEADKFRRK